MRHRLALTGSILLPAAPLAAQAPDPLLARIEALEAKVNALEARNRELEAAAHPAAVPAATDTAAEVPPKSATPGAAGGIRATVAASDPAITIQPRVVMQLDYAAYHERAGGYRYDSGTDIRRGRFGFEGSAFTDFRYRINAEFLKNTVNLLDAFVQYVGVPHVTLTVGQHKTPFSLEANDQDWFNTFLERGMAVDTFLAVGADRRVGASVAYQTGDVVATIGAFGAGEAVTRNAQTPDETHSLNGRVTWEPSFGAHRQLHLGASAFHVTRIAAKTLPNLGDRPEVRVDGGLIEAVTVGPIAGVTRGARAADFLGGEAAAVWGPVSLQGEYDHLAIRRYDGAPTIDFDGFYTFATVFLTGESRSFRGGLVERIRPTHDFSLAEHQWGAFEIALRYDRLNLSDSALSALSHRATTLTGGLNWYLNPNTRVFFNYIRFKGTNSPLVAAPASINGTTAKGDVYASRLQFDF